MACCVDRCTKPLTMLTKLPNYTSDKLTTLTNITTATVALPTLINKLSLIRNFNGSDVLVEGVVQISFSGLNHAGGDTGTIDVELDVYRTAAIAGPIYTIRKTIFSKTSNGAVTVVPTTNELAFQFTDNETTTPTALPDGLSPAEYYVQASVITSATLAGDAFTVNVTRSDAAASEEVVYV